MSHSLTIAAQVPPKPKWAQNGVKSLNDQRKSLDYRFVAFRNDAVNDSRVVTDPLTVMRMNMASEFGVDPNLVSIDSIIPAPGERMTYSVTYRARNADEEVRVYVQKVDSYMRYEDNIDGSYDYDIYSLYAISNPDIIPTFDDFELTRRYGAKPVAMSLIPGLGQIYKGQPAKGYSLLGAEVLFAGAITFGELNRSYYMKQAKKNPDNFDSWKSKANGYRAVRNIGIVLGAATYLYNLLDAAFAKGAPHVIVKHPRNTSVDMVFSPYVSPDHFGAALSVTF